MKNIPSFESFINEGVDSALLEGSSTEMSKKYKDELTKIQSTAKSCETLEQLSSVENMLSNFMSKLRRTLNDMGSYSMIQFSEICFKSGLFDMYTETEDLIKSKKTKLK